MDTIATTAVCLEYGNSGASGILLVSVVMCTRPVEPDEVTILNLVLQKMVPKVDDLPALLFWCHVKMGTP